MWLQVHCQYFKISHLKWIELLNRQPCTPLVNLALSRGHALSSFHCFHNTHAPILKWSEAIFLHLSLLEVFVVSIGHHICTYLLLSLSPIIDSYALFVLRDQWIIMNDWKIEQSNECSFGQQQLLANSIKNIFSHA